MSVLIKGIEMPKTGRYFVAVDYTDGKDKAVISVMSEFERGDKTRPLLAVHEVIPVPPHGRLIDANALIEHLEFTMKHCTIEGHTAQRYREMIVELSIAPTIIPAEEGE